MNRIPISIEPISAAAGSRYHDLSSTTELLHRLWQEWVLDSLEFQTLTEWDLTHPPRDEADRWLAAWEASSLGEALNPVCTYPAIWPMAGRAE